MTKLLAKNGKKCLFYKENKFGRIDSRFPIKEKYLSLKKTSANKLGKLHSPRNGRTIVINS